MINNRCVLQQQHVDCKIVDTLLKNDTNNTLMTGTRLDDVTKDAAYYTTTSRFVTWFGAFSQDRQWLCLSKDDLRD
jgi:hypothetical protein